MIQGISCRQLHECHPSKAAKGGAPSPLLLPDLCSKELRWASLPNPETFYSTIKNQGSDNLPPCPRWWISIHAHGGLHFHVAQELGCLFGNHRVDEHAGAEFEAGRPREPRDDAHVPVEIARANQLGGSGADSEIEVRVVQSVVELRQHGAQDSSQVNDFLGADVAEAGHMAARIDVGEEGRG